MLELEKQNLHRNRLKGQTGTQVTLDDDFIVPDTMSDVGEIILDCGSLQLEPVKVQRERVTVRGKLPPRSFPVKSKIDTPTKEPLSVRESRP